MALDAIVEVVVKAVGQFLAEVIFVGIFYWPGWLILRMLTFGRYPPKKSEPHSEELSRDSGLLQYWWGCSADRAGAGLFTSYKPTLRVIPSNMALNLRMP